MTPFLPVLKMPFSTVFNNCLDRLAHPEIRALHRYWQAYQVCGYTGFGLGFVLTMCLAAYLNLSLFVMSAIAIVIALVFFGLAMTTKIVTGEEQIIYYHHEIAVMIATTLFLRLLQQPVLPYLDITILGVGLFLACGRVGCLMAGCCHGQPHSWGVAYGAKHAAAGLGPQFVGVRLFPVQALESLLALDVVLVGVVLVTSGGTAGEALAWYVVAYGAGRFFLEFIRGDTERRYYLGFSEAQWISLMLMCAVAWAGQEGALTFHFWHFCATAFLGITMIVVTLRRATRRTDNHLIFHPCHMREFEEAVQHVSRLAVEGRHGLVTPAGIHVGCTSLGIQVSASRVKREAGYTYLYALSDENGTMSEKTARMLSSLIIRIRHPSNFSEVVKSTEGVFHLLVHSQDIGGNAVALRKVLRTYA